MGNLMEYGAKKILAVEVGPWSASLLPGEMLGRTGACA